MHHCHPAATRTPPPLRACPDGRVSFTAFRLAAHCLRPLKHCHWLLAICPDSPVVWSVFTDCSLSALIAQWSEVFSLTARSMPPLQMAKGVATDCSLSPRDPISEWSKVLLLTARRLLLRDSSRRKNKLIWLNTLLNVIPYYTASDIIQTELTKLCVLIVYIG